MSVRSLCGPQGTQRSGFICPSPCYKTIDLHLHHPSLALQLFHLSSGLAIEQRVLGTLIDMVEGLAHLHLRNVSSHASWLLPLLPSVLLLWGHAAWQTGHCHTMVLTSSAAS
jgi:hypothetical protein